MPTDEKLAFFRQGDRVVMVEAPAPAFEPMVGWTFTVIRASWRHSQARLRADYDHTGGLVVELVVCAFGVSGWKASTR